MINTKKNTSMLHRFTTLVVVFAVALYTFTPALLVFAVEDANSIEESQEEATQTIESVSELSSDPIANADELFALLPQDDDDSDTETDSGQLDDSETSAEENNATEQPGEEGDVAIDDESVALEDSGDSGFVDDSEDFGATEEDDDNSIVDEIIDEIMSGDSSGAINDPLDNIDEIIDEETENASDEIVDQITEPNSPSIDENANNSAPVITGGGGGSAGGGGVAFPEEAEDEKGRFDDIIKDIPATFEEILEYRENRWDEQEVITGNTSGNTTSTSTEYEEPEDEGEAVGARTENNVTGNDDVIINNEDSSEDGTVIENENYADQVNVTEGSASSGENLVESEKDVLEANIKTGNADITAEDSTSANVTAYQVIYGGGTNWTEKTIGANNSSGNDDVIVTADGNNVRKLSVIQKDKAFITNVQDLVAVTGKNEIRARDRLKDSSIVAGKPTLRASMLNIANTTTYGEDAGFLPLTLNIFGDENGRYEGNVNILKLLFEAFGMNLDGDGVITSNASNSSAGDDDTVLSSESAVGLDINIDDEKEGYIYNDQKLGVISGQNKFRAGYKAKDSFITTENAKLTNMVVNFLNTTLFQSKVGIIEVVINADEWLGNLIVPDADMFASQVPNPRGAVASSSSNLSGSDDLITESIAVAQSDLEIVSENVGGVVHDIKVDANTGNNRALFDKDAEKITDNTGDIDVLSSFMTLANRNVIGTAFSQAFYQIFGEWDGELVGADGARVQGEDNNFMVASEADAIKPSAPSSSVASNEIINSDDTIALANSEISKSVTVNTKKDGIIANVATLTADTGNNEVVAYKGDSLRFDTGDIDIATTFSNYLNNTFSFSKGLILSLKVLGDWKGNIAYNEVEDLSVDIELVSENDDFEPGDQVEYDVVASNTGTEPVEETSMYFDFPEDELELISSDGGNVDGSTITWSVPAVDSAENVRFRPVFRLRDNLRPGTFTIETRGRLARNDSIERNDRKTHRFNVTVGGEDPTGEGDTSLDTGDEGADNSQENPNTDDNQGDTIDDSQTTGDDNQNTSGDQGNDSGNSGNDSGDSGNQNGNGGGASLGGGGNVIEGDLEVIKTANVTGPVSPGDTVTYTIVVQNPGQNSVSGVFAYDAMVSDYVNVNDSWDLGVVNSLEEVVIEYDITIPEDMPSGEYTNTAYASGFGKGNEPIRSNDSSVTIVVDNPALPLDSGPYDSASSGGGGSLGGSSNSTESESLNNGSNANTSASSGGAGPIEFGVINSFEGMVDGESAEEFKGENSEEGAVSSKIVLGDEDIANLESSIGQQVASSLSIDRGVVGASTVYAAEVPEEYQEAYNTALNNNNELAYNVYPNFLQFGEPVSSASKGSSISLYVGVLRGWLFWLLIIMVLFAGYVSYREKQQKNIRRTRKFE